MDPYKSLVGLHEALMSYDSFSSVSGGQVYIGAGFGSFIHGLA